MHEHNIVKLLHKGVLVTINSDDPAYFGGYVNANYEAVVNSLHVNKEELKTLAINSFKASFLSEAKKQYFIDLIEKIQKSDFCLSGEMGS